MAKRIAIFNHKGGVGKTTATFHLGWMLASKGKRVIMVDADPQCHLTGWVLNKEEEEFENFYRNPNNDNLKSCLTPAFESQTIPIEAAHCQAVKGVEGLFLLPGHLRLFLEHEMILEIAQELSSNLYTLRNIPGAPSYLLSETAEKYRADYLLIDMSSTLNSITQNLFITSDYFLVPLSLDYFSVMALKQLTEILPQWSKWANRARSMPSLREGESVYPFPNVIPKFLGVTKRGNLFRNGQDVEVNLNNYLFESFIPALRSSEMTLSEQIYENVLGNRNYSLADFSTVDSTVEHLLTISQTCQTPVFSLSDEQIGMTGALTSIRKSCDEFQEIYLKCVENIIQLTNS